MVTYKALKSLEIKHKVDLLGKLIALQERVQAGLYPREGICSQVQPHTGLIKEYFVTWPMYSGKRIFPIVAPISYLDALRDGTLWADDEYGNARRDLLTNCIKELQKELSGYHALMLGLQEVYKAPGPAGICNQDALYGVHNLMSTLRHLFVGWSLYSGDISFPVPAEAGYTSSREQFFLCPKWKGAYGDRRRDLLVCCIDQLRTGLGSYTP